MATNVPWDGHSVDNVENNASGSNSTGAVPKYNVYSRAAEHDGMLALPSVQMIYSVI